MVWKTGKFGVNNGRTVRCRPHSKRSEGLLIRTTADNSPSEGKQDEGNSITYSLGKQNRWLLPELIKASSFDFEEEEFDRGEEVVLVERYTNEGNEKSRRPDCFSVFNSTNSTTRKSKRKLARAKDLLSNIEPMKTRYEIAYPHPAGSWPHEKEWSTKRQRAHLCSRKKNTYVNWTIEEDIGEFNEPDKHNQIEEDDFSDQSHSINANGSLIFDLELFVSNSSQKRKSSAKMKKSSLGMKDSEQCKEAKSGKGDAIYVESGDEMYDEHEKFLALIGKMASTSDPYQDEWSNYQVGPWGGWGQERSRRGRGRGRGRGSSRGSSRGRGGNHGYRYGTAFDEETMSSASRSAEYVDPFAPPVEPVKPVKPVKPVEPCCDDQWVSLVLNHQETSPGCLEEKWGDRYKETACFPRAFILNATSEILHSSDAELFVLFRLVEDNSAERDTNKVKASTCTVVISSDESGGAHELVLTEFISQIKAKNSEQAIWFLEDVVDIAKSCFQATIADKCKADFSEPRKQSLSLDMFTELFGWKSETFSLKTAQQQVKKSLKEKMENILPQESLALVTMATYDHPQQLECGICFMQFDCKDSDGTPSHFTLRTCSHKFCNDCWRAHLKTQIQHGHTDLKCPGHECTATVDDVTLMSLLPSWYNRYITKRLDLSLEMDPKWKWCPADRCKFVVKATTPQVPLTIGPKCVPVTSVQPVPVVCFCGNMWCFKCQEDAHWPATCDEARTFRENTKRYAKMVANSQSSKLIMSVQIKNCPFCHYPIQKGPGCNHMRCGLCNEEFCWFCLEKYSYDHVCEKEVVQREVELPISTKHLRSYEHFAVTSRIARSTDIVQNIQNKLDRLDRGLQIHGKLSLKLRQNKLKRWSSRTHKTLNHLYENNTVFDLQVLFSFKFQALLAVEGLAMVLSFTKAPPNRLVVEFERLVFIVERMDAMLKDFNKCCHKGTLERLKRLVKCGKESFMIIEKIKK